MKWFLLFQAIAWWPASPQQIQVQGPFTTEEECHSVQKQLAPFKVTSECIYVPTGQAK